MDNEPIYKVPPIESQQPKKSWLSSHMILGVVFVAAALAAIVAGIYYWQTTRQIPAVVQAPTHQDDKKDMVIVNSFTSCVSAGYPVMESSPEQCRTPDGLTFVKPIGYCIQVIAEAKNPATGEIREFPTPCDIPVGWQETK